MTITSTNTRDALVACATAMLDTGQHELSLRAVARAAGVSAMAPYRHFPDKAALLRAVADAGFGLLHDALVAADAKGLATSERRALVEQGVAYVAFARARPALFRLMFTGPPDPSCAPKIPIDGDAYTVLAARVAAMRPDDAGAATMAAWSIVHGMAMLVLDGRLPPDTDATRSTLDLFVTGLVRA